MIAPLRLFQEGQILFQRLCIKEGGAIDALEHRVAFISAPVGPRNARELESLEITGMRNVRTAAKVDEIPLLIKGNVQDR